MMQGDEPLITPDAIEHLINALAQSGVEIANLMGVLRTEEEFRDTHNVKVVTNKQGDAMYFSREAIPSAWKSLPVGSMHNQMGIIGFKRDALIRFNETPDTALERFESVDMNRVIENGGKIRMVPTTIQTIGVDTPADLAAADEKMDGDPYFQKYAGR
jgi:3-deoxy-manno-octulosonate cytidylyltransferase (CMP-KDO synthetase)